MKINGVDWGYFGSMIHEAEDVVRSYNVNIPEYIEYNAANITKNWGRWELENGLHKIKIAKFIIDSEDDHVLMNTLIHEILHACFPKDGHKGKWKKIADKITSDGKYNITRLGSWAEFEEEPEFMFKATCNNCGHNWYYFKAKPLIRKLVKGQCTCPYCEGRKFIVYNKYNEIIK